jgi:hypothetical protein
MFLIIIPAEELIPWNGITIDNCGKNLRQAATQARSNVLTA